MISDTERLEIIVKHQLIVTQLGDNGLWMLQSKDGYPISGSEFPTWRQAIDAEFLILYAIENPDR
jgi:hypothetical protein